MQLRALDIALGSQPVGLLLQYGSGHTAMTRLVPDERFWSIPETRRLLLSLASLAPNAAEEPTWWRRYDVLPFFNGAGERLPPFLQSMLPEGPLRRHLAQLRGCEPSDHFELLAMCGTDLPGNVYATPATLDRDRVAALVTQHHDALEMTVVDAPVAGAASLSGVQPKLGLVLESGRYVARTQDSQGLHIIAKLPTAEYPLLPEVEELSLRMAAACGVNVCTASLAPVSSIVSDAPLIDKSHRQFLAVTRFDRSGGKHHIHAETFAQVFNVDPEDKYTGATYGLLAGLALARPGLGEPAALEIVRRITVNELLGNYDAHLANFGLVYPDGNTPTLSPAYDVVAYAAYLPDRGHALRFHTGGQPRERLSPANVRGMCDEAGLLRPRAEAVIRDVVKRAEEKWPALIASSGIQEAQKARLLAHIDSNPLITGLRNRRRA